MTSKNIFSRFFSFLAMATLLVACSQSDDNAMTTNNTNANRAASLNLPNGKLIINNNTHHTFVNYLWALNILRPNNDGLVYWLKQEIIINPYTNIELDRKYSKTTEQLIDYNGNAEWIRIKMNGSSSIISEQIADDNYRGSRDNGTSFYVEWNSFDGTSDDGTVKFKFKVDAQTGEIFVNEPYGTFETTAFVNDSGDIVIRLEE